MKDLQLPAPPITTKLKPRDFRNRRIDLVEISDGQLKVDRTQILFEAMATRTLPGRRRLARMKFEA